MIPANRKSGNLGPRLSVLDNTGKVLTRIGVGPSSLAPDAFIDPRGVAVDTIRDIYVGEVSQTKWLNHWPGEPTPRDLRCLRKPRKLE